METTRPLSARRQRKHDSVEQKIIDAARGIMREQGVAALSMQELARRVDLSPSSLYHYFDGKMRLYDALFQLGFSMLRERVDQNPPAGPGWQAWVRTEFENYLGFALENPELYQLCFERPVPGFIPSAESLALSTAALEQAYRRAEDLQPLMQAGLPPQRVVDLMIALMHGITALHLANEPGLPAGQGRYGSLIPAAVDMLEKAWSRD